jgi:hypothetical protein
MVDPLLLSITNQIIPNQPPPFPQTSLSITIFYMRFFDIKFANIELLYRLTQRNPHHSTLNPGCKYQNKEFAFKKVTYRNINMPASVHEDHDQSMVDVDAQQENGEVIEVGENRITIVGTIPSNTQRPPSKGEVVHD